MIAKKWLIGRFLVRNPGRLLVYLFYDALINRYWNSCFASVQTFEEQIDHYA